VILVFVVAVLGYLAIQYLREPMEIGDPPSPIGARAQELMDRLDPNTAGVSMLAAIPQMGEKRAAEIVEYRELFMRDHPGQSPFTEPRDLLKLKNFGVATLTTIEPYLVFGPIKPVSETQSTERSE
jgi:hypothetical protein